MHKVLLVDHASAIGGAEVLLLQVLKYLNRERWLPHLACTGGPLAEKAGALGIPVHRLAMPRLRRSSRMFADWYQTFDQLATLARETDAAILHSNTTRSAFYTSLAAKLARRPYLWHMHDFWLTESEPQSIRTDRATKQILCRSATQVIGISNAVAQHVPCHGKTTVILNGIETARFHDDIKGDSFRHNYDIPIDAPVVGMVGRLRPWKGQEVFLRGAALLLVSRPDTRFLIVGGDPFQVDDNYGKRLVQITQELELAESIIFTGQIEDVRPALAAMDVYVHPGQPEPFGLVNIEAMAMAKPVVAFAHGALPEIVVNGETGHLVSPGDKRGMVQAIDMLLDEPQLAAEMGRAGRARVEQHFTIQQTVRGIEQVYEHILSQKV